MKEGNGIMDAQKIFDTVARHLLTQRRKSEETHGLRSCLYRKSLGDGTALMCAVGCLIPDESYSPDLEGKQADDERVLAALPFSADADFLRSLQDIHDYDDPQFWPGRLRRFADDNALSHAVVDEIAPTHGDWKPAA
jgi:hypothetical protein